MGVYTKTISFIIFPFSLKYIPIHMPELPLTVSFIISPVTFIPGSIRPSLNSIPMFHFSYRVAFTELRHSSGSTGSSASKAGCM